MLFGGSGPEEEEMRLTVERERVPNVHFAGFLNQSEISRAYACADVFTLLSRNHETFGAAVAEAMNFSLPLVLTDKVGCSTDLVTRGRNGYVVSADDPDAAAAALGRMVGDGEVGRKMGAASRARIDEWNPQLTIAGILEACRAVRR